MRKTADQTKLGGQPTKYLASTLQHCEEKKQEKSQKLSQARES